MPPRTTVTLIVGNSQVYMCTCVTWLRYATEHTGAQCIDQKLHTCMLIVDTEIMAGTTLIY